ncbi:MAG: hypothetical protein IJW82_03945 [Clostridia bacterium]|nr:hypothetical protein [Clostridia bacterium]
MKKIFAIFFCFLSLVFCVSCDEKINIEDTNVVQDLKAKIQVVVDDYYQKYNDKTFKTDDVKEKLYVCVASKLKTCYSVSFGSVNFDKKEKLKFNIGNNSYIYADAYLKQKDSLYVFAPLLALEGGNSKTLLFCVDGLYFSVKVYDGDYDNLSFIKAYSLNNETQNVTTEKNSADRNVVTHKANNDNDKLGLDLNFNQQDINLSSIFFIRKSYQKYSKPTEYLIYVKDQETSDIVLTHDDIVCNLKQGEKYYIDVEVTLFGGGELGFDLWIECSE